MATIDDVVKVYRDTGFEDVTAEWLLEYMADNKLTCEECIAAKQRRRLQAMEYAATPKGDLSGVDMEKFIV